MSKHTPGPWKITHGRVVNGEGSIFYIAPVDNKLPYVGFAWDRHNADLFLAAPDLLAAAERAELSLDTLRDGSVHCLRAIEQLRAAIAKARGEE